MDDHSNASLLLLIGKALTMTETRVARLPAEGSVFAMFASIRNQLVFMRSIAAIRVPTMSEKNSLNAHVIAVREFEVTDPEYAAALQDAVSSFKKL